VSTNVDPKTIDHVLDLLEEAREPKVSFTGDLEGMKQEAERRRIELINAAMEGLYRNVVGILVRHDLEERFKQS
jgi:hypothetical protein